MYTNGASPEAVDDLCVAQLAIEKIERMHHSVMDVGLALLSSALNALGNYGLSLRFATRVVSA